MSQQTSGVSPIMPASALPAQPGYPPDSRYAQTQAVSRTLADGRTVTYLRRRFIPPASDATTQRVYRVQALDRLDNLAAAFYGDSQLWWRIVDANPATDPDDLLTPGSNLRIPRPDGFGSASR